MNCFCISLMQLTSNVTCYNSNCAITAQQLNKDYISVEELPSADKLLSYCPQFILWYDKRFCGL